MSKKKAKESKFRNWYADPENRTALNKRRRDKYKKNKEYRAKVLDNTRRWRKKQVKIKKSLPKKPKTLFSIGEAAYQIGCEQKTIRTLEKFGLIPGTSDGKKHRRFTGKQIALVGMVVNLRKAVHYRNPKYAAKLKKLSEAAHKRWG